MVKKDLRCPKCNKVLLRGYSGNIDEVHCKCGCIIPIKDNGKIDTTLFKRGWKHPNKGEYRKDEF